MVSVRSRIVVDFKEENYIEAIKSKNINLIYTSKKDKYSIIYCDKKDVNYVLETLKGDNEVVDVYISDERLFTYNF